MNPIPGIELHPGQRISFIYTNYRKQTSRRLAVVQAVWWGSTDFHPTPQTLLRALCLHKDEVRDFALADVRDMVLVPIDRPAGAEPESPAAAMRRHLADPWGWPAPEIAVRRERDGDVSQGVIRRGDLLSLSRPMVRLEPSGAHSYADVDAMLADGWVLDQ